MAMDRRANGDVTAAAVRRGFPVSDEDDRAARDRLVARADEEGMLDVAYRTIDSPIGALLLAATPVGLVRVAFEAEDHDAVLADLSARLGPRILSTSRGLDAAARQLDEFLDGRRDVFDVRVDLQLVRGFRREVLEHLQDIGYGVTRTYAQVAVTAGRPAAVRAVGSACSHNPVPLVVPCHRVVRSDGTIGQYAGGADLKRMLLEMESAA